jgi:hypothetical protein
MDSAKSLSAKFKNLRRVFRAWKVNLPNLAAAIRGTKETIQLLDIMEEVRAWKANLPNLAAAIRGTKETIQLLDIMEEVRDLILEEWNFRGILLSHLDTLLHQQRVYWKQRGTINWVKLGDECTAFFHVNASMRLRRNSITTLKNAAG